MTKKKLLIVWVLLILFSLVLANYTLAGCCFTPGINFCQDVSETECCGGACLPGLYNSSYSCINTKCEDYGCCVEECSDVQYKSCSSGDFDFWNYGCSEPVPEGCQKGCCVYLQEGDIKECANNYGFGVYKKDCVASAIYDQVFFYEGYIGTQCTNICGDEQAPLGNVSGYVSFQSGAKVSNALVRIADRSTYTNANGYYRIDGLAPGTETITASYEGWVPASSTVAIVDGQTTSKNLTLTTTATTGTLSGHIWNRTRGTPLKGALVSLPPEKVNGINYAFSDSTGAYTISNIYPGTVSVSATASRFISEAATINIVAGISTYLNFTLQNTSGLTTTTVCGDGSVGSGEQCDDGNTANGDGCSSTCQIEVCGQNIGDCCEFNYLCPGSYLTAITNCGGSYYGCCNTACYAVQQCVNGYPNDLPISQTQFDATHPGPMCECGTGNFYNTSNPAESSSYCCNSNFQSTPCSGALGRITGFAKDNETNEGLNDVTFSLKSYSDLSRTGGTPSQAGFYSIDLPAGTYNLTASKAGYTTSLIQGIVISSGQLTNLNVLLDPLSYECTGNIPAPLMILKNIKGTPAINITWEQPCKYREYSGSLLFFLFRNGKPIGGAFSRNANSYIDKGTDLAEGSLQWGTTYAYTLNVTTTLLGSNSTTLTKNTGSIICKEKFGDEELCIDSSGGIQSTLINRATCDDSNTPRSFEDCVVSKGTKSVCVGHVNNITHCSDPIDCKMLGIPQNVFGMYYGDLYPVTSPVQSCLRNLTNRTYCYYDYSATTVDKCIDCSQKGRCYEYNSSDSCSTDNCYYGATHSTNCRWTSGYFSEFGKGICYEESYKGTDYCSLCNQRNSLFENIGCTTQLCSLLGKCYSSSGASCEACSSATTCETYYDELSCIGSSSGFDITRLSSSCNAPVDFSYSTDSCSLGKCKWIENACVKDADDNDIADCSSSDTVCKQDVISPSTVITRKPAVVNSDGATFELAISDFNDINKTYYCIGQGVCCPDKEVLNKNITLPNNDYLLIGIEGNYNISFYSIDKYKNMEKVKTEAFYVDTKRPAVVSQLSAVNNPLSTTTSDLLISITVDEYSLCKDSLKRGATAIGSNLDRYINADSAYNYNYSSLADGTYYYSLTCTDMYGNQNSTEKSIYLDRVYKIFNAAPVNLTTSSLTVALHLETPDMLYCRYNKNGVLTNFNSGVFGGEGIGYPSGCSSSSCTKYLYDISETSLVTGAYNREAECWSLSNGQGTKMDSTNLVFTVDKLAPETKALYEISTGTYAEINNGLSYQNPLIKFNCSDPRLGPPPEFGCNQTKYCVNISNCAPNNIYSSPLRIFNNYQSGTYNLCYSSKDNGGNAEQTQCISVIIDTTGASVAITTPSNNYVTNQRSIDVTGTWSDSSGINSIKIEWSNGTSTLVRLADKTGETTGTFSTSIDLYNGGNSVKAIAEDSVQPVPNRGEYPINIYYDLIGPVINAAIYNLTRRIDHDTINYANGESGYNITFSLSVKDMQWYYLSDPGNDIKLVNMTVKCVSNDCSSFGSKGYVFESKGSSQYEKVLGADENLFIGDYNVTYYAEDFLGNPSIKKQTFSIVDTTPVRIELIEPALGRVNNSKPLIKIRTDEEAWCDLTYSISGGSITENFITTDGFNHLVQISQALSSENGKDTPNTLSISCTGVYTGRTPKSFTIVVDLLRPSIYKFSSSLGLLMTSTDDSKYYLVLTDEQDRTKLSISATEDVRCRYDSEKTEYSQMQNTFLDYDKWLSDEILSDWIYLSDNHLYTFNIACEDKVGWLTGTKVIQIEVNYSKPIMVLSPFPLGYINDSTPDISVKTIRDANCYAAPMPDEYGYSAWAFDYETNVFNYFALMSKDSNNAHTTKIANISSNSTMQVPLEENKRYLFRVVCEDPNDQFGPGAAYIFFFTDYTLGKPTITSPAHNSIRESAYVNVIGSTEANSTLQIYINNKPKLFEPYFTADGSFNKDLTLDNGTNYIRVEVVDKAGNRNSETVTVNYANVGPSVRVILPSNRGPFKSLKQMAAVFTDNGGGIDLDSSYIKLRRYNDGFEITSTLKIKSADNNSLVYNLTSNLENGIYRVDAVPIDNFLRVGDVDTALFEINSYVPGITIESPRNMETITDEDKLALFKGTISADEAVSSLALVLNGNKISLQPAYSFETTRILNEGSNVFYMAVNTTIGNYGESPAYYVILDTTGPSACINISGELQCPDGMQPAAPDSMTSLRGIIS